MKLLNVLLVVLAISTIACENLKIAKTQGKSAAASASNGVMACTAWKAVRKTANNLLMTACKALGTKTKNNASNICDKLPKYQDDCKKAMDLLGNKAMEKGCPYVAERAVELMNKKLCEK